MKDNYENLYTLNVSCLIDTKENNIHFILEGNVFDVLRINDIAQELDKIINQYVKEVMLHD